MKTLKNSTLFLCAMIIFMAESCKTGTSKISSADSANIFKQKFSALYHISNPSFNNIETEITIKDSADIYINHFETLFSKKHVAVWVDISKIAELKDRACDGLIITPIAYPYDIVSPIEKTPLKKDQIGFMVQATKKGASAKDHVAMGFLYDFNNPCPNYPHCNN